MQVMDATFHLSGVSAEFKAQQTFVQGIMQIFQATIAQILQAVLYALYQVR